MEKIQRLESPPLVDLPILTADLFFFSASSSPDRTQEQRPRLTGYLVYFRLGSFSHVSCV